VPGTVCPAAGWDLIELLDTDRVRLVQTTFVQRDYRHVESDIVLTAPYRPDRGREKKDLFVYHAKDPSERPELQEMIETSVAADQHRQELWEMSRTIADELQEEGARLAEVRTRQQTLTRLMQRRFGEVPARIVAIIEATSDVEQLDHWLDQFVTAERFVDFDFGE